MEMRELIDERTANLVMNVLAIGLPLLGLVAGAVAGILRRRLVADAARGVAMGAVLGIGNLGLWRLYNAITDHYGLDTVKNLLINLGLFVLIGVTVGILIGLRARAISGTKPAPDDRGGTAARPATHDAKGGS